jgi:hypothetical protein
MARSVLMEEFHLTVYAPGKLSAAEYGAIHRTLNGRRFRAALDRAVKEVVRRYPSLKKARFTLTR